MLAEVRYWDELIDNERGRSKLEVLARLEEQRAWALVRLINLAGAPGSADRARKAPHPARKRMRSGRPGGVRTEP